MNLHCGPATEGVVIALGIMGAIILTLVIGLVIVTTAKPRDGR